MFREVGDEGKEYGASWLLIWEKDVSLQREEIGNIVTGEEGGSWGDWRRQL